jgi:type III secretory pathway component EscV
MRTETAGGGPPLSSGATEVAIRVELGSVFKTLIDPSSTPSRALAQQLASGVKAYLREVGIPGTAAIEIAPCATGRLLRVLLNGRYYEPSDVLFVLAWDRIAPLPSKLPRRHGFAEWLIMEAAEDEVVRDRVAALGSFVAEVAEQVLRRQAKDLFGEAQAADLLTRAPLLLDREYGEALASLEPARLVSILRPVLDAGVSLTDQGRILKTIVDALAQSKDDISEVLISDFSTKLIRVRVGPEYLRKLLPVSGELQPGWSGRPELPVRDPRISQEIKTLFGQMRDQIFFELGIRIPEVIFETDQQLGGSAFQIAVNDRFSSPQTGLKPGERLVNAPRRELPEAVAKEAREATAPPIDGNAAIVLEKHKEALAQVRLTTWGPLDYVLLSIAREAKRNAWRLMNTAVVETELALLDESHVDLALAALREITPGRLARVLRELLREQVCIRDFVTILERLLTFGWVTADTLSTIVYDDRLAIHPKLAPQRETSEADLAQYVRFGLKRAMILKRTQGLNTLSVLLLHPEIESRLLDHVAASRGVADAVPLNAEEMDRIRVAIRSQADLMGPWGSAIVTSVNVRRFVGELIADELPDVPVFSYEEVEIGPDFSVQQIAQISL